MGEDYSAFEVFNENAEQCAEFKSNTIKPYAFAELINDTGVFYGNANLIVEKMSAGHTVTRRMNTRFTAPLSYSEGYSKHTFFCYQKFSKR